MRVRGALHMHSTFSHDGTLSVRELAEWYRRHDYQFIAITEHAEDLDDARMQQLCEESRGHSNESFLIIPGAEFSCGPYHVLGIGAAVAGRQHDALAASETIHRSAGMAVLAHPRRCGWTCPPEILRSVDAVEIWNVGYDGKYLPSAQATSGYAAMKRAHAPLLAIAGHDLHQLGSFYDVALELNVDSLSSTAVLRNLRQGCYMIGSRFFRADSHGHIPASQAALLRLLGGQLRAVRRARSLVLELLP